ncbi:hypothetical protein V4F87_003264 [Vibrio parahaemolyticus]|nr:hypothetical protein [Vibrio parahaemolyticus]
MLESNFIAFLNSKFPDIPVFSFEIPQGSPSPSFCFENAGMGIHQQYTNGEHIEARTIKLTLSSENIKHIYDDGLLHKYIMEVHQMGELSILNARILNFSDLFDKENKIYERTYTISIKYKR